MAVSKVQYGVRTSLRKQAFKSLVHRCYNIAVASTPKSKVMSDKELLEVTRKVKSELKV